MLRCRFLMARSSRRSLCIRDGRAGQRRQQALVGAPDGVASVPSHLEADLKAERPASLARLGHLGPHPGPVWPARTRTWVSRRPRAPACPASAPPGRPCKRSRRRTLRHCLAGHRPAPHVGGRHRVPLGHGADRRGGGVGRGGNEIGAGPRAPAPPRSRRRDAGTAKPRWGWWRRLRTGTTLTRSARRPSRQDDVAASAADHGQKHGPGDETTARRT